MGVSPKIGRLPIYGGELTGIPTRPDQNKLVFSSRF